MGFFIMEDIAVKRVLICTALCLGGLASAQAQDSKPTVSLKVLSPSLANKAVVTAVEDCTKRGYKVSAAIVDRTGNLAAYLRNPLSGPHTEKVSQRKAWSAATFQTDTKSMQVRTDLNYAPDVLLVEGGLPISIAGNFYGGIAVAGADPADDVRCAQAGIDAIAETLEFAD